MLQQLESGVEQYCDITLTHVRSSSRAAVAANILESVLIKQAIKEGRSEDEGRADATRLMAGASEVESALMLEELDSVVHAVAADALAAEKFLAAKPAVAITELRASRSAIGQALDQFLDSSRSPRVQRTVHA